MAAALPGDSAQGREDSSNRDPEDGARQESLSIIDIIQLRNLHAAIRENVAYRVSSNAVAKYHGTRAKGASLGGRALQGGHCARGGASGRRRRGNAVSCAGARRA